MADDPVAYSHPIRVAELRGRKPQRFSIAPDGEARARIATALGLVDLAKVAFEGELRPAGRHDWLLEARLGATVIQPCVISLAPVTTRLEEPVTRRYIAEMEDPAGDEVEMPEDDTAERLPAVIDIGQVLTEALSLALPLYPRAPGVELVPDAGEDEGSGDSARRPFAGLAELMRRHEDGEE